MSAPAERQRFTFAEYLAREAASDVKHEFHDGEIVAMAGGTPAHSLLAAHVIRELGVRLAGRPCEAYTADLRIRVRETGLATYPDVSVICGPLETDPDDPNSVLNPIVLVEVLSDSTEAYDRGAKFAHYRRIPSLRAYVLVSHREPLVEVYAPTGDGRWLLSEARPPAAARIDALECELPVADVYAGVT